MKKNFVYAYIVDLGIYRLYLNVKCHCKMCIGFVIYIGTYIIVINTKEFEGDRMRERRMTDGEKRERDDERPSE